MLLSLNIRNQHALNKIYINKFYLVVKSSSMENDLYYRITFNCSPNKQTSYSSLKITTEWQMHKKQIYVIKLNLEFYYKPSNSDFA